MSPVLLVFMYGLFTAATTALGALPFAFVREVSHPAPDEILSALTDMICSYLLEKET